MPANGVSEPQVRFFSPMPNDYHFVPKGDVYITSNVRKRTHAVGATLYVVVDKHRKPIGLRCPTSIYQEVTAAAQASAANRAAVVQSRDAAVEREFEAELLRLYPDLPRQDVSKILKQALEKRSRRVGRTGTLDLESRVHLAVKAYIRHCHTPYEQLLKDGIARGKARQMVTRELKEVARLWMGSTYRTTMDTQSGRTNRKRKTTSCQPGPRKRKTTGRPPRRSAQPDCKTGEGKGDVENMTSAEESERDDLSIFDDDPEDSDWIP
ncbi:hypothetical protein CONLIGDRAFT_212473 [Coniochaeta ligniaria NRRL 30616]|uniref:DUF2293 domain-containing protein n=1 Tax=Coniochaeta ligniaria NRRL 30616 TaxID=1408157 RepID=A0A1J7JVQ9_9PEZI|nr:hypothetical protein CONLIGDRAFT_212473 [Coniochaeta ligniaria NRRL 30616]